MGKVLNDINSQIERNGKIYENVLVLKLYNSLVSNGLKSSIMFSEMTHCKFIKYGKYSYESYREWYVKPEFLKVISEMNRVL